MQETKTETAGFRLSPQQQQLLAVDGAPGATQCAALLHGPVDVDALRAALDSVVARHEILRTTFVQPAGMRAPQQIIGEQSASAWSLEERPSDAEPIANDAALEELMAREAERGFDLERGPLLRALLLGGEQESPTLVLTACAACADSASLLLALTELCESYGGATPAEEPVQYADYAEWRHELIADEESQVQDGLAFWREDAADRPAPPRILFALRDATGATRRAAPLELGGIELNALQRAAVGAGVPVAVFLEAAWHALVARMSGASELLLAGWADGRAQPDLAQAIGAYEQPVPIRSRFQDTTTFAEIVDQVRRSRAQAVRWQDCGAAEDLAAVAEQAAAGWTFSAVGQLAAPARSVLALRLAPGSVPLVLALRSTDGTLEGEVVYDPHALAQEDAREIARRFATLLSSAIADPSLPVAQLEILDAGERDRLLESSAADAPAAGAEKPVHERFEEQARSTPDRLAVVGPSGSLTYAELDAAANRLAHHLQQLGPVRQQQVGLCMERTPSMIAALLAILKAGGAYVPLNYEHPPARIAHQLSDAGVRVLVTEQHLLASLPQLDATVVCVDRDAAAIAERPTESPDSVAALDDLAYVMYTSGSTGTPKGVAVTHANLAGYAAAIAARLSATEDPDGLVFGVVSAISTDLGNTSIFTPLVSGGCIRLIGAEAATDGGLLAAELDGEPLDVLKIAPSHLRALLAANGDGVLPRRWLVVGGEALRWELVEQVESKGPDLSDPQPLRPHRDDRRLRHLPPRGGVRAHRLPDRADRLPARGRARLCARLAPGARASGCARRAVHRRRGGRRGLPRSRRRERRAVHRRPVRGRQRGGQDVPHGRPRAAAA